MIVLLSIEKKRVLWLYSFHLAEFGGSKLEKGTYLHQSGYNIQIKNWWVSEEYSEDIDIETTVGMLVWCRYDYSQIIFWINFMPPVRTRPKATHGPTSSNNGLLNPCLKIQNSKFCLALVIPLKYNFLFVFHLQVIIGTLKRVFSMVIRFSVHIIHIILFYFMFFINFILVCF